VSRDPDLLAVDGPYAGAAELNPLIRFLFIFFIVSLGKGVYEKASPSFGFDGEGDEDCFCWREGGILMEVVSFRGWRFIGGRRLREFEFVGSVTAGGCCCCV
jgi:hypothetical protein